MGPRNDLVNFVDLFDEIFSNFEGFFDDCAYDLKPVYACASYPPTDVYVKENKDLVFEFAVAGYPEDAINLDFHGDYMTMKADMKGKKEDKGHFLRRGIKHSKVEERYYVPSSKYNKDEAKAELKNGLLIVVIPAKEEAKPKSLKINLG